MIDQLEAKLQCALNEKQTLEKEKSNLEMAQKLGNLDFWELDLRINKLYWSDETYHIFNIPKGAFNLSFEQFLQFIHPEDRHMVEKEFSLSVEKRSGYSINHRLCLNDGTLKYVREKGITEYDEKGEPVRSFGTVLDITEQIETQVKTRHLLTQTIKALSMTLEKRDPYTSGHQIRVAALSLQIGDALGWEISKKIGLYFGAMIHDIGKIYIPSEILNRPGKLSQVEFELIKTHPQVGYDIISTIEYPLPIKEVVLQHHERLDGSGYPRGLYGGQILQESRVIAVADSMEAMINSRPFRTAMGKDFALEELQAGRGTKYDPVITDICKKIIEKDDFDFKTENENELFLKWVMA